jgi:hypothetical protein
VLGLDRASYRPGEPVRVTVTLPAGAQAVRGHVRLRCHLPPEAAMDPLVDPMEPAGCEPECVEIARAELAPLPGGDGESGVRMTATVHLPPDAEPSCRGCREVVAWEVLAVVQRRASNAWVDVVPRGA